MQNQQEYPIARYRTARRIGQLTVKMAYRPVRYTVVTPAFVEQRHHSWRFKIAIFAVVVCIPLLSFGLIYGFLMSQMNSIANNNNSSSIVHEEERPKVPIPEDQTAKVEQTNPEVYKDAAAYIQDIENATTLEMVKQSLDNFGKKYGLVFSYTGDPTAKDIVAITSPTESDLGTIKIFAKLFVQEWSKYPDDWLASSYYDERPIIVLTKTLEAQLDRGREQLGGLYTQQYARYIYYNIEDAVSFSEYDYAWGRGAIHHEAGHAAMMGMASPYQQEAKDAAWELNSPAAFTYATNINENEDYYHPSESFVTQYARFSADEDKAEVFSYVMTSQYRALLNSWTQTDALLAKKVAMTKDRICSVWKTMCGTYYDNYVLTQ